MSRILGHLHEPVSLTLGALRDSATVKAAVRIEDVIAFCFRRVLYAMGCELRTHCWRPSHTPDRHPNCRIDTAKQVFYCDVCASGGDVFTVVRERLGCSFRQAVSWLQERQRTIHTAVIARNGRLTNNRRGCARVALGPPATYCYFDRRWRLLFTKLRTPAKDFFYRRPLSDGTWAWGLGEVQPVLYYWPALIGLSWVLVVEGEKDADSAWDHDLPATTNPEGASDGKPKWRDRYTRALVDAGINRVYVIPDDDRPGRRHAGHIVASCRHAGLDTRLVRLPGLAEHGDLSDYFALGHTRRDVVRLLRRAR